MQALNRWIEITFVLVALYLVLMNANGFSRAIGAVATGYSNVTRTLQGR